MVWSISFNPHKHPTKQILIGSLFSTWANWGSKWLSHPPKLVNSRAHVVFYLECALLTSLGGIVASQLLFSELFFSSCSVAQSGPTLCDPMDFPVLYSLLEFAQTHVHWVGDALQPSHPLSPSSPLALRTFMGDQPWANDYFLASPFLCLYFSQSFLAVQESYLLESLFSALTQKHLKCIHTLRNKYLNQSQVSFLP